MSRRLSKKNSGGHSWKRRSANSHSMSAKPRAVSESSGGARRSLAYWLSASGRISSSSCASSIQSATADGDRLSASSEGRTRLMPEGADSEKVEGRARRHCCRRLRSAGACGGDVLTRWAAPLRRRRRRGLRRAPDARRPLRLRRLGPEGLRRSRAGGGAQGARQRPRQGGAVVLGEADYHSRQPHDQPRLLPLPPRAPVRRCLPGTARASPRRPASIGARGRPGRSGQRRR